MTGLPVDATGQHPRGMPVEPGADPRFSSSQLS